MSMTFAAIRQAALQAGALSSDLFAETVTITSPVEGEDPISVRAKIEHEDMTRRRRGGTGSGNESIQNTLDERERICVVLSRDVLFSGSYPSRPPPAASLCRAEARDPDRRPFVFRGEILFEGDQHARYIFERPRRVSQGKGN